jgi:hypothetical protein
MFGLIYGGAVCRNAEVPMDVFVEQFPLTLRTTGLYAETFRRRCPRNIRGDWND